MSMQGCFQQALHHTEKFWLSSEGDVNGQLENALAADVERND
jgi:hypothetical protein